MEHLSPELPPNLRISTMTAKSKIGSIIDIESVYKNLEINDYIKYIEYNNQPARGTHEKYSGAKKKTKKKVFYNQITIIIVINNTTNNIKLFNNGSISMTGVKSAENGRRAVDILLECLKRTMDKDNKPALENDNAKVEYYEIVLINSDYDMGYEIKRSDLHQLLVNDYKIFSSFEPCIYPGVNSKFYWNEDYKDKEYKGHCYCNNICSGKGKGNGDGNCKKITISAFQSGSIIITGAQTFKQIIDAYNFINNICIKHEQDLKKINAHFLDEVNVKITKSKKTYWIRRDSIIYN